MTRFVYTAKVRLQVDGKWREPGDLIPEAATWRNLQNYLNAKQIEEVAVPDTVKVPGAVEKPDWRAKSYAPAEEPGLSTPPPVAGRERSDVTTEVPCRNCLTACYVLADLQPFNRFECHYCNQIQTVADTQEPHVVADWQRSTDARSPLVPIQVRSPFERE